MMQVFKGQTILQGKIKGRLDQLISLKKSISLQVALAAGRPGSINQPAFWGQFAIDDFPACISKIDRVRKLVFFISQAYAQAVDQLLIAVTHRVQAVINILSQDV